MCPSLWVAACRGASCRQAPRLAPAAAMGSVVAHHPCRDMPGRAGGPAPARWAPWRSSAGRMLGDVEARDISRQRRAAIAAMVEFGLGQAVELFVAERGAIISAAGCKPDRPGVNPGEEEGDVRPALLGAACARSGKCAFWGLHGRPHAAVWVVPQDPLGATVLSGGRVPLRPPSCVGSRHRKRLDELAGARFSGGSAGPSTRAAPSGEKRHTMTRGCDMDPPRVRQGTPVDLLPAAGRWELPWRRCRLGFCAGIAARPLGAVALTSRIYVGAAFAAIAGAFRCLSKFSALSHVPRRPRGRRLEAWARSIRRRANSGRLDAYPFGELLFFHR